MQSSWKQLLIDSGAEFSEETPNSVRHYGNLERETRVTPTGNVFYDLSHQGLIEAHGADSESFLQAMLSNDVTLATPQHSQLTSLSNPKGRLLAIFRLFRHQDSFYLSLPDSLVEPIMKRLRLFVLRSKVTLENADDALIRMGCSGPEMDQLLKDALNGATIPGTVNDMVITNQILIIRTEGIHPRFELYGNEVEVMRDLWTRLNVHAAPVGHDSVELLDILAGIPTITPQTSELFVAQMVNLDRLDAISFSKGCYPGQEIVARTHYLGHQKRRMYRFRTDSAIPGAPGSAIMAIEKGRGEPQPVGHIVRIAKAADGRFEGLAVLRIEAVNRQTPLFMADRLTDPLFIQPPPYPLVDKQQVSDAPKNQT